MKASMNRVRDAANSVLRANRFASKMGKLLWSATPAAHKAKYMAAYRKAYVDEPCTWATKEELAAMWDAKYGAEKW